MAQRNGTGMFPREVMKRFPLLPLEEEGRLNDMPLRENFIERVFAYYRWTRMLDEEPTPGGLVKFHTAHKLTLMAHSPKYYTEMGRLVADAGKRNWEELTAEYGSMLMEGLGVIGTRGKHVNVLQHLMGYLKNDLSSEDKQELLALIEDYRQGLVARTDEIVHVFRPCRPPVGAKRRQQDHCTSTGRHGQGRIGLAT